jgi:putative NADPH-quinone reductase
VATVVVQAHPLLDSYSGALLERVRVGLDAAAEPYGVFRLGEGERPVAEALDGIERLVLVYPTWWGGQPAMLLDWIQTILRTPGALSSVRRLTAVTSLGSSRLVNRMQGEWGRANLAERVLSACADGAIFEWVALYKIDRQSQSTIDGFLGIVEGALTSALPAR